MGSDERSSPATETLLPCPIGCTGSPQHMYREICRDMQSTNWNKPISRIWCPCCGISMVKEGIEEVKTAWNTRWDKKIMDDKETRASQPATPTAGEPVAWRYRASQDAEHREWCYTHRRRPKELDGWQVEPLYAAPATASDAVAGEAKAVEQILHDHFYTGEPGEHSAIKAAAKLLCVRDAAATRREPANGNVVTVKVPDGYVSVWEFLNDCGLESVDAAQAGPDRGRIARAICCPGGCKYEGDSEDGEKCWCDTSDFNGSGIERKTDAVLSALSSTQSETSK